MPFMVLWSRDLPGSTLTIKESSDGGVVLLVM